MNLSIISYSNLQTDFKFAHTPLHSQQLVSPAMFYKSNPKAILNIKHWLVYNCNKLYTAAPLGSLQKNLIHNNLLPLLYN